MDKGESTPEDIEKLKKMVPKSYQKYIESECSLILIRFVFELKEFQPRLGFLNSIWWENEEITFVHVLTVYGNGYLTDNHHETDLIEEEDYSMMDQSQSSYSQDSTRFDSHEFIEEDTIGSDEGI